MAPALGRGMLFRQLFDPETSTYTYLFADPSTGEAAIIDPVREQAARDIALVEELGLRLVYTLETHVHADHVTGSGALRAETGATAVVGEGAGVGCADVRARDGDELALGKLRIRVISTPGHTSGCVSYLVGDRVFTGDALLIRGTGRTDFQSGSAETLYDSITEKLFTLPPETLVYPGHDYKGRTVSTIGEEMRFNPRLAGRTKQQFVAIMDALGLPPPKRIAEAVPANQACGHAERRAHGGPSDLEPPEQHHHHFVQRTHAVRVGDIYEVDARWTREHARRMGVRIIDVRSPDEFESGHVEGSELVPLDRLSYDAVRWDRRRPIVTICRSGARSARAALVLAELGFCCVASARGGILALQERAS